MVQQNSTKLSQIVKVLSSNARTLTTSKCTIKYSFTFAEEIQSFDSNLAMASFDIESPFTNFLLQETIDLCVENLFKDMTHIDNLSKDSFVSSLLGRCLNH